MSNEIVQVIGSVGFPIVACVAMGWFCQNTLIKVNETMSNMTVAIQGLIDAVDDINPHRNGGDEK